MADGLEEDINTTEGGSKRRGMYWPAAASPQGAEIYDHPGSPPSCHGPNNGAKSCTAGWRLLLPGVTMPAPHKTAATVHQRVHHTLGSKGRHFHCEDVVDHHNQCAQILAARGSVPRRHPQSVRRRTRHVIGQPVQVPIALTDLLAWRIEVGRDPLHTRCARQQARPQVPIGLCRWGPQPVGDMDRQAQPPNRSPPRPAPIAQPDS